MSIEERLTGIEVGLAKLTALAAGLAAGTTAPESRPYDTSMSADEVYVWLTAHGVSPHVAANESGYISYHYRNQGPGSDYGRSDIVSILERALPHYLDRSRD